MCQALVAVGSMGHMRGATKCEPLVTTPGPTWGSGPIGIAPYRICRSCSMRLSSTEQMQRGDFDKRLTVVLSVFLWKMRWLMVRRNPTAMSVLGQGHIPVRRYIPPPPRTGHKATTMR